MFTRLSFRVTATVALVLSAFTLTPLGAGAQTSGAVAHLSLRSPAWMRTAPIRATVPTGGALTTAELPGASNPSEPYAASSQAVQSWHPGGNAALTVNPVTGVLSLSVGDLAVPERGVPLGLSLTYNSYFASTDGPFGRGWSFNDGMRLTRASDGSVTVSQENGSQVTFRHKSTGYSAPPRAIASLREVSGKFVFTRGTRSGACPRYSRACVDFVFGPPTASAPGRLVQVSAPDGGLTLTYSGLKLTTVGDPPGRTLTFGYGGGRVKTATLSCCGGGGGGGGGGFGAGGGGSASMSYDANGNLKRFTDASGASYRFLYASGHILSGMIDPRGAETDIAYDSAGRVQSVADPAGETDFGHPSPQAFTMTHTGGYTAQGVLRDGEVTRLDEGGTPGAPLATTLFTYDPATLGEIAVTNPDGQSFHMTYDSLGHRTSVTDPLGHTSSQQFDALTGKIRATDAMGNVSTAATDTSGRVKSITKDSSDPALAETTTFHYGSAKHPGDITSATDPEGHTSLFTYDKFGNPTSSTDPLGDKTTTTYDRFGRPAINTAADGNVAGANPDDFSTEFTYDPEGRMLSRTDPLGNAESFSYDPAGNLIADVQGGEQTSYGYDAAGRLTSVTRPDGSHSTIQYDAKKRQTEQCDDRNSCTLHTYDTLGRLVSVTDPLGNTTGYVYSAGGLLDSGKNANGVTASYSYDAASRMTGVSYDDGITHPVTYGYDANGQMTGMTDGTGASSFTYDSLGNLTGASGPNGDVTYVYDHKGNVQSIDLNSVEVAVQTHDAAGRLVQLRDRFGNATAFTYDASGNLTQTVFPGGDIDQDGYDAAGRKVHAVHRGSPGLPPSYRIDYTRDQFGQITLAAQTGLGQPDQTYTYKHKGVMTAINSNPMVVDSRGNLVQNAAGDTFTYNTADRLLSETEKSAAGNVDWSFAFDNNGSRTSAFTLDGTQSHDFVWDAAGNLTSYSGGSTSSETNTYDGLGRLVSSSGGGSTHLSVWGSTNIPARLKSGNYYGGETDKDCGGMDALVGRMRKRPELLYQEWDNVLSSRAPASGCSMPPSGPLAVDGTVYLYGPEGLPVEQVDSSGTALFYHHDQLGSTRAVTDAKGQIVEIASYDEWGNVAYHSGTVTVPFGFAGAYTDPISGLVSMGGSPYDPATGQCLRAGGTRDPIAGTLWVPVCHLLTISSNPLYEDTKNSGVNPFYNEPDKVANPLYDQSGTETTSPIYCGAKKSGGSATPTFVPDVQGSYNLRSGIQVTTCGSQVPVISKFTMPFTVSGGDAAVGLGLSPYTLGGGDPVNQGKGSPVSRSNVSNN